jgi:hypothetical protein
VKFRARIIGAARAATRLLRGAHEVQPALRSGLADLARSHTRIMRSVAPRRSGRLASRIIPEPHGGGYQVISPVTSDEGFHYTRITRSGHNVAWIYPKNAQALRFSAGGRTVFASRVRGYRPASDWVDAGIPAAEAEAERAASRIGRQIAEAL